MKEHINHIHYVEFRAKDLEKIKTFYSQVFSWVFTDYGPDYIAFANSGLEGGFERSEDEPITGALVILYHSHLEDTLKKVTAHGGKISKEIFSFPGGRRFHFLDPCGNELAVWSDL